MPLKAGEMVLERCETAQGKLGRAADRPYGFLFYTSQEETVCALEDSEVAHGQRPARHAICSEGTRGAGSTASPLRDAPAAQTLPDLDPCTSPAAVAPRSRPADPLWSGRQRRMAACAGAWLLIQQLPLPRALAKNQHLKRCSPSSNYPAMTSLSLKMPQIQPGGGGGATTRP